MLDERLLKFRTQLVIHIVIKSTPLFSPFRFFFACSFDRACCYCKMLLELFYGRVVCSLLITNKFQERRSTRRSVDLIYLEALMIIKHKSIYNFERAYRTVVVWRQFDGALKVARPHSEI